MIGPPPSLCKSSKFLKNAALIIETVHARFLLGRAYEVAIYGRGNPYICILKYRKSLFSLGEKREQGYATRP